MYRDLNAKAEASLGEQSTCYTVTDGEKIDRARSRKDQFRHSGPWKLHTPDKGLG